MVDHARDRDSRRFGCDAQARRRAQVVETEADVGLLKGDVRAALDIRRTALRIVDGDAVDGDTHQVEAERVLRVQLARHARDVHAVVVVQYRELVVHDLDGNVRRLSLDKAGVDDILGVHVTASLELGLGVVELHVGRNDFHGAPCTRCR